MKRLLIISLSTALILSLCSCQSKKHLEMNTENADYSVSLPYTEDFEGNDFQYVVNTAPDMKWAIKSSDGNRYLECVAYDETQTITGNNIHPILIGDRSWPDYEMSFDVRLDGDCYIMFAPFADSINPETSSDYGSGDPWSLYLNSNGELYYQTFLENGYMICDLSKVPNCFEKNGWNHITLYHNETEILMTINGVDIGKVADYNNEYHGRISFGGTVGVMIDNIKMS